ncbi:MAG: cation-translocating P-type ATPase [Candidatus Aenigmatarchaeota archaeon]|nr:MAG: cation-translocating P-type ATPase [Candidatus Aenigmarchaeota archaeon]
MLWHSSPIDAVYKELNSSASGLSSAEAPSRLERYGRNELKRVGGVNPIVMFFDQFKNFLVILLLIAALVSAAIGEGLDAIAILAILVLNAALGFFQEYKAERALEALRKMVKNTCTVIRDGRKTEVVTSELVPGDIVTLEPGDKVPADARIVESSNLKMQEASLTGESVPVKKFSGVLKDDATVVQRTNMVFMGTDVSYGVARAIVVSTGMQTELGRIASLVQEGKEKLPLEIKMEEISKKLGLATLVIVAVVALAGVLKSPLITLDIVRQMFIVGVALAVAAIPEGLPAVVTVSLALGVQRMVKRNAIIRKLPAVETLGSISVICTDKTGTLTQNRMTVTRVYCDENVYDVTGIGYKPEGAFTKAGRQTDAIKNDTLMLMLRTAVLANNAEIVQKNGWDVLGDPTEGCLLTLTGKAGLQKAEQEKRHPRMAEIPFDAERKMMSTVNAVGRGLVVHTKGAPEEILERCDRILADGRIRTITQKDRVRILSEVGHMGSEALRVLAFAYREIEKRSEYTPEQTERELVFLGIAGMMDPPREEIKSSIAKAREAGIRTIMVTGDNALTARAIAQLVELDGSDVVEGKELDKMGDDALAEKIRTVSVFARVDPEHKVRIVDALKKHGHVVAMTGDGVNDAPALKKSDVGVAMGVTGTDVAKEASDMVLVDDNYSSIVAAIEEGRGVYDNVQKFVNYLLSSNIGEVFVLFFGVLLFPVLPLQALQLLWINIATDGLPAIALGADPISKDAMRRKPVAKNKAILDWNTAAFLLSVGATMAVGTLALFYAYLPKGAAYAQTVAFTTIVMYEIVNVFCCRTNDSLLKEGILRNKYLLAAVALSVALQFVLLYTPLAAVFEVVPLTFGDWVAVVAVSLTVLATTEIAKRLLGYRIID